MLFFQWYLILSAWELDSTITIFPIWGTLQQHPDLKLSLRFQAEALLSLTLSGGEMFPNFIAKSSPLLCIC